MVNFTKTAVLLALALTAGSVYAAAKPTTTTGDARATASSPNAARASPKSAREWIALVQTGS